MQPGHDSTAKCQEESTEHKILQRELQQQKILKNILVRVLLPAILVPGTWYQWVQYSSRTAKQVKKQDHLGRGVNFLRIQGHCIRLLGVRPHSRCFIHLLACPHSGLPVADCRQCQLRAVCPCLQVLRSSSRNKGRPGREQT